MRRISCAMTAGSVRDGSKTLTTRDATTWTTLKRGEMLAIVEKAMGLPKGSKQRVLAIVEVVDTYLEPLDAMTDADAIAEGVHEVTTAAQFVAFYAAHARITPSTVVRRIRWRYVECIGCAGAHAMNTFYAKSALFLCHECAYLEFEEFAKATAPPGSGIMTRAEYMASHGVTAYGEEARRIEAREDEQ